MKMSGEKALSFQNLLDEMVFFFLMECQCFVLFFCCRVRVIRRARCIPTHPFQVFGYILAFIGGIESYLCNISCCFPCGVYFYYYCVVYGVAIPCLVFGRSLALNLFLAWVLSKALPFSPYLCFFLALLILTWTIKMLYAVLDSETSCVVRPFSSHKNRLSLLWMWKTAYFVEVIHALELTSFLLSDNTFHDSSQCYIHSVWKQTTSRI